MLELRIRACHVHGSFVTSANVKPARSRCKQALESRSATPAASCCRRRASCTSRKRSQQRWPAAVRFITERGLNEFVDGAGDSASSCRAVTVQHRAARAGTAGPGRRVRPLAAAAVRDERGLPAGRRRGAALLRQASARCWWSRKASRTSSSRTSPPCCAGRRHDRVHGKDCCRWPANTPARAAARACAPLPAEIPPGSPAKVVPLLPMRKAAAAEAANAVVQAASGHPAHRSLAMPVLAARSAAAPAHAPGPPELQRQVPARPPGFCTGCPERPIFTAMKLVERELGAHHVSATSAATCSPSCRPSTWAPPPWATAWAAAGASALNTAASAPSRDGRRRLLAQRPDQRHRQRGVQQVRQPDVIVDNSYSAATGGQDILSSAPTTRTAAPAPIEKAVRGVGVKWVRTVTTPTTWRRCGGAEGGADHRGEGPQGAGRAERMHAQPPAARKAAAAPAAVAVASAWCASVRRRPRHLHRRPFLHPAVGLPVADASHQPRPARTDPVARWIDSCVGCGLCGEVAHAAVLCPSFYRRWERTLDGWRRRVVGWFQARQQRALRARALYAEAG
jgi:indolepyruvate ferredoxin oxidoreductase alpha subunit